MQWEQEFLQAYQQIKRISNNLKYFQKKMSVKTKKIYKPKKLNNKIYSKLYALYSDIHDAFGTNSKPINTSSRNERFNKIKR